MYLLPLRMKALRKAANLSRMELAHRSGYHLMTVTKWETGAAVPRADALPKLAAALGCEVGDLFTAAA